MSTASLNALAHVSQPAPQERPAARATVQPVQAAQPVSVIALSPATPGNVQAAWVIVSEWMGNAIATWASGGRLNARFP